jgi:hypothetical protein
VVAQELPGLRVMDTRRLPQAAPSRTREASTAQVLPITAADLPEVAEFLATHHNAAVPWLPASVVPWRVQSPNHGFMLKDGERVVGTVLALYSERSIAGRVERFCNMGSWCVLPEYRSRSMALLKTLLSQPGFHFTTFSPDDGPQEILAWLRFRFLDTSATLIPNLPWPSAPGRVRVLTAHGDIEEALHGSELQIYQDHVHALAARHVVLRRGAETCYVVYRVFRYRGVPVFALILHVSDPESFRWCWRPLTRHLLLRHALTATLVERRMAACDIKPSFALMNWPKMYRSDDLGPADVDYLYSELTCVPW